MKTTPQTPRGKTPVGSATASVDDAATVAPRPAIGSNHGTGAIVPDRTGVALDDTGHDSDLERAGGPGGGLRGDVAAMARAPAGSPAAAAGAAGSSTRGRLLETAAILFRRSGYDATTTRELAGALSIQSASLYHHIGKKEDLLYELCLDALGALSAAVEAEIAGTHEPLIRLRRLIRAHLRAALADQDKHSVMLFELRALTADRRREVVALRDAYEALFEGLLSDGQAAGVLRNDVKPKYLALALLNLLNWTIFWYRPDGDLSPDDLAELLATLYIEGAARRDELRPESPAGGPASPE